MGDSAFFKMPSARTSPELDAPGAVLRRTYTLRESAEKLVEDAWMLRDDMRRGAREIAGVARGADTMSKMKTVQMPLLILAALGLSAGARAEEAAAPGILKVQVTNVQRDEGQIGCSLYSKEDGFPNDPDKADERMFVEPKAGKATCTFRGVKPGTYAVSVMHDADKNGELKTNLVGRPKEWWGVSNDVPAERFGPPKYDKATFEYAGTAKTVEVKLQL
jgi:uncharacterized protein (DUF2141 family)